MMEGPSEAASSELSGPSRPRRRGLIFIAVAALALVIVLAGIGLYLLAHFGDEYPDDLASYAPPESAFYVSVDSRPFVRRAREFYPTIRAWRRSQVVAQGRERLRGALRELGVDMDADVAPWLGPVNALALMDLPAQRRSSLLSDLGLPTPLRVLENLHVPGFVVILSAQDTQEAARALKRVEERTGARVTSREHRGIAIRQLDASPLPGPISYAIADKLVFMSNRPEELDACIDRRGGGSSLARTAAYRQVADSAMSDRTVSFFVRVRALQDLVPGSAAKQPQAVEAVGGGIALLPGGLKIESIAWGAKAGDEPTRKAIDRLPPVGGRAFQFLPKDTVAAIAMQSPATYYGIVADQLDAMLPDLPVKPVRTAKTWFKRTTGIDLDTDIIGWMSGEAVVGIYGVTRPEPGERSALLPVNAALIAEGKDARTVSTKLRRLEPLIQTLVSRNSLLPATWAGQRGDGIAFRTLTIPNVPVQLSMGNSDRLALVATGPAAIRRLASAGKNADRSLASDGAFRRVRRELPRRPNVLFFAVPGKLAVLFEGDPQEKMLSSFGPLAYAQSLLPQGAQSVLHLEMNFPRFIDSLDELPSVAGLSSPSADQATCLANVKAIALAMLQYAGDNDGRLPDAERWPEQLRDYLKGRGPLKCPADQSRAMVSYGMNAALSGKRLGEIGDQAGTVLVYETRRPGPSPYGGAGDVASARHAGGSCYAFADGSVRCRNDVPSFGR